jgi:putative ABC transport system permease protein
VIGGAIGSALGILMGRIAIGRLPAALTQGLEARIEYCLPGYAIPAAIATTALTSVVASAMAARQVYKVAPIEALAPVGVSAADRVPRWLRVACGVGAVVVFAVSIAVVISQRGVLAFIAMSAVFSAELALGFALTMPIVKAAATTARIFGTVGALAAATIERAPRRVWATVMTVVIAVITTVTITGTNTDMIRSARGIFAPVADVPVWVSASPPDTYPTDALPQDLSGKLATVPGVAHVTEGAFGFAEVGGTRVMLDGFADGTADPLYRALDAQVRDQVLAGHGIVLSQNLGKTLHVRVGDQLRMQTPHGVQQATVLALVPYFSTVIGTVGMSLDHMRAWFDRPVSTTLQIAAAPGVDPRRLLTDIRGAVPAPNYVYDGRAELAGLEAPMHQSQFIANAVWIIVVLVAGVALLNTLTLSVLERRREIGVLRAMGSSRRFTLRMVLAEAAGIGVVGGVLGLVLGCVDQWLFSLVSGDMMNFHVTFRPSWMALAFTLGALAISLLGSVPPARRAARLNIIEAVGVE